MANQINIDIGAAANDGTGDPLRTAFNYVNLNFANVWATGLPNSNVQFNNNRILTVNTNANLVLAPNGIGIVQSNVSILPNIDRVHSLGSATRRWYNVYSNYLNINAVDVNGNLTVAGNLTVEGDTIQIGNIVTDTKTIQLSNTAVTANTANGSGVTVGANDNIATLLYNSAGNVWATNIGISAVGNITAPYFIGNGSLLTGIGSYSNANVAAYLPVYNGNISAAYISVANNVNVINDVFAKRGTFTGDLVTGDASMYVGSPTFTNLGTDVMAQFTGNVPAYAQINLQNYGNGNTASGDYIITADNGTDNTHFLDLGLTGSNWDGTQPNSLGNRLGPNDGYLYVQDGNMVIGTSNGNIETWKFDQSGNLTVPGDVIPAGNNTQSLGSATNQWADLWVSNATIYMNSVPITLGAGNVLTVNGEALLSNDSNTSITTTGNISADYFFGNGSQLTGIAASTGDITFVGANISAPDDAIIRIQAKDSDSVVRSYVRLDPDNGYAEMRALSSQRTTGFTSSDWATGVWTGTENNAQLAFTGATDIVAFLNGAFGGSTNQTISVNGGEPMALGGYSSGGSDVTFFVDVAPPADPTTITSIEFGYYYSSRMEIDYDDDEINILGTGLNINITSDENIDINAANSVEIQSDTIVSLLNNSATEPIVIRTSNGNTNQTWEFGASGNLTIPGDIISLATIDIDNRASGNSADINLYAADDITIQARDRTTGSTSEGGDINIYAGDSAEDGESTGGDVIIEAGNGGSANVDFGGSGGFIRVQAGRGGDASTLLGGQDANSGGELTLRAGDAGSNNGNIARGAAGGDIRLESGDSTGNLQAGGDIILATGTGGANAGAGAVLIDIPSSDQGPGGEWLFGSTGNSLSVPQNAEIFGFSAGNITVGTFGNAIVRTVSAGPVTYDWVFGDNGMLTLPNGDAAIVPDLGGTTAFQGAANTGVVVTSSGNTGSVTTSWVDQTEDMANARTASMTLNVGGTADVQIQVADLGANTISNWTFESNGTLTTPGNISMDWLNIGNVGNITSLEADVKLQIVADAGNAAPYWTFNNDGTLFVPGNISGDNSAPLIVEGSGSGEGYISLPSASFGGEQVVIVNKFSLGNGIRLETNGGNLFFDNTGNLTVPGNIIMPPGTSLTGSGASPAPSISGFSSVSAETLSATGNITGGNISATGNITAANLPTKFESTWAVATGNSTQSFTVDGNNTYQMWVEGNIPNGIIAWNATVSVTNTNVPVIGQQFAWNYEGAGNPIMLTSIPAQIIGTAGAISNASPVVANTNVFSFGINNASGNVVEVRYGWVRIS